MSHENQTSHQPKRSIWYTYFGKGSAGVFAFIWILLLLFWLFSVLMWGGQKLG